MQPRFLLLAPALLLTSACSIGLLPKPKPAPIVYSLEAAPRGQVDTAQIAPKNVTVAVAEPTATRALTGRDISWRKDGALAYVEGASWEARNTDLLQTLLVDTIDRHGGVRGAIRAGDGSANVELHWDIAAFEVDEDHGLQAVFRTTVKLFDARTRQLIMTKEFDETSPLSDRSARIAAAALEAASRAAAEKIADWTAVNAPEPPPEKRPAATGELGATRETAPQTPEPQAPAAPR
ncbi:MAG: ABC-type transport auxiliary lipoprotein family protein [Alphaproteobacteria bacterium]